MPKFKILSPYQPCGDQPQAIARLVEGLIEGQRAQTLLGITGSGKTMTMAWVVEAVQRPTLVIAHNKTLAAQLYGEFRELFPQSAVEYFVSYYDYYQPEAYLPNSDTYIEKDAKINEEIDRMRHSATRSLLERNDVLIVATVSCIYGIGSAEAYHGMLVHLRQGQRIERDKLLRRFVDLQYDRNDVDFYRGTFRVRGDTVEIFPAHEEERAIRLSFWDDELETIQAVDPFRGEVLASLEKIALYPNSHYVVPAQQLKQAMTSIQDELQVRLEELLAGGRYVEEQRLRERTLCDLEMLEALGYCNGIENYSRHLSGRQPGEPPPCLLDYFPDDFLLFVDESHATLPQLRAMYRGDRSRKTTLVEHGFRLPSALDNRPLQFEEFEQRVTQAIFVSATPGDYEREHSAQIVEQIIRPTGLMDPDIEIRPALGQVDDLLGELQQRIEAGERVLVTTLTKRMSEKLCEYYQDLGIRARYLHSEIDTVERVRLLRELRLGEFDVLIGINLLREGLDLPEVSLVAVLDADKEGFLRSTRSLLQTAGRAARNLHGKVILYADKETPSIRQCVEITQTHRQKQADYNRQYNITPQSVQKNIQSLDMQPYQADYVEVPLAAEPQEKYLTPEDLQQQIAALQEQMLAAAKELRFEEAARLRDEMRELQKIDLGIS